VLVVEVHQVLV
jgi:hypothetical protein